MDRHHADEDVDVPGLDDVLDDADRADEEEAAELLEGLLGPDVNDREDIPSEPVDQSDSSETDADTSADETATGRWACRFCETERRRPSSVVTHHATCPDS